jgi:hypothetical protein
LNHKGRKASKNAPCFKVESPFGGVHYAQSPRGLLLVLNRLRCTLKPELWVQVETHYRTCGGTNVMLELTAEDFIHHPILVNH